MPITRKDAAVAFLRLVTEGRVAEAFDTYAAPGFRHHNAFSRSDAASLRKGMEENHAQFPDKLAEQKHVIGEGDMVVVHSRVLLSVEGPELALTHIFRFEGEKIAELWDVGQQVPKEMANELGMF